MSRSSPSASATGFGNWITHNEPWVVAWIGHGWGHHAPGRTSEPDALATAHHLLLSHGRAVEILRRASPDSQVGITLNLDHAYAASGDPADAAAALWVDGFHNRWFLDPIFRGTYPEDMAEAWAERSCRRFATAIWRRSRRRSTSSA